jgi:hypothetical protein
MRQLKKNKSIETLRQEFINGLPDRGIPLVLFVARLRGLPLDGSVSSSILLQLDNAIIGLGPTKEAWLYWFEQLRMGQIVPTIGAHDDF